MNVPDGFEFGIIETDEEIDELVQFNTELHDVSAGEMLIRFVKNLPEFERSMNYFIRDSDTGKIVSSLNAIPSRWSYDGIPLQNLELGFVGTLEDYRNRGLFTVLYSYFDRVLQEGHYDLSSIQGIPYFYRRYDYDFILPLERSIHLPVLNIPQPAPETTHPFMDIIVRPADENDMKTLMSLFLEANQNLLVSTIRSEELWQVQERLRTIEDLQFKTMILERNGVPDGYFRLAERLGEESQCSVSTLIVKESSIISYDSVMRTLHYLKAEAQEKQVGMLELPGNLCSNLGNIALDYGGVLNQGWKYQIRIPNMTQFLNRIHPALENRLKGTMFESLTMEVFINTYSTCYRLKLINGSLEPIEDIGMQPTQAYRKIRFLPQSFIRLMLGEFSVTELKKQNIDCIVQSGQKTLLETLFPVKESFLYTYHC